MDTDTPIPPKIPARPFRGRLQREQAAPDWARIPKRSQIALFRNRQQIASGWIDDVMPDGSGLWLIREDNGERKYFIQEEGLSAVRLRENPQPGFS